MSKARWDSMGRLETGCFLLEVFPNGTYDISTFSNKDRIVSLYASGPTIDFIKPEERNLAAGKRRAVSHLNLILELILNSLP
jgi:hypothetical protein